MYLEIKIRKYQSSFDKEGLYPEELKSFEQDILSRNFASVETEQRCQVGYWRKANAIHSWFVRNCANGEDNCKPMYVSLGQAKELLEICKKVLEHKGKAKDILPTTEGFFFGSQEYDEWYYDNIKYTVSLLEKVIPFIESKEKERKGEYYIVYVASW